MLCGGKISSLPLAIRDETYLDTGSIEELLRDIDDEILVYEGTEIEYDEDDDVLPKAFRNEFVPLSTLFFVPGKVSSILTIGKEYWPACLPDLYVLDQPKCCQEAFDMALERVWRCEPEYDKDVRVVGEVDGETISRTVRIYSRPTDIPGE